MKAQRERLRQQTLQSLRKMPPGTATAVRAQMQAQDKALAQPIRVAPSDRRTSVDGVPCRVVTWRTHQDDGEACLATAAPGIDVESFRKGGRRFRERLQRVGIGTSALSIRRWLLAPSGFPMRHSTTTRFGGTEVKSKTVYGRPVPKSFSCRHFAPPAAYRAAPVDGLLR